ncbi:MAG: hypothetical protein OEY94_00850 [Alphaproteobacteria bacterium]|nr:hypothetical protein [Alphaproteobacteria bacterium]
MKHVFLFLTSFFLIAIGINDTNAEEVKKYCHSMSVDYINPVLKGVKNVVITVDVKPNAYTTDEAQAKLPKPLRKESLEKLLVELYTERFNNYDGTMQSTSTRGCHDRNNQPVRVIDSSTSEGRKEFHQATLQENTLALLLHVRVTSKGSWGMDMNSDIVSFYLSQMRKETDDYTEDKYMLPFSMTTSTYPKILEKYIKSTLKNRINHDYAKP